MDGGLNSTPSNSVNPTFPKKNPFGLKRPEEGRREGGGAYGATVEESRRSEKKRMKGE